MKFDFNQQTKEKDCTFCGNPIRKGMEVKYNHGTYHPTCATTVAKEKQVADNRQTTQQR